MKASCADLDGVDQLCAVSSVRIERPSEVIHAWIWKPAGINSVMIWTPPAINLIGVETCV